MKKLKDIWYNNRILIVLGTIILICFIIICVVCYRLFFNPHTSVYGNRLDDIQNMPLTDETKEAIMNKLKELENVLNVDVHTQGKIIRIRIEFTNTSLDRAKEIAATSLEVISDEYKALYDINYTIVQESVEGVAGYLVEGAKNIGRQAISWHANYPVPTPEESEE